MRISPRGIPEITEISIQVTPIEPSLASDVATTMTLPLSLNR
jgi:hypothetical protein